MSPATHHSLATPHSAGHWPFTRRRRTPGADRKARSRPLIKAGGGVLQVRLTDLEGAARWLTDSELLPCCKDDRQSIAEALAAYVEYRVQLELEELLGTAGRA